jgi:hypothetical protein
MTTFNKLILSGSTDGRGIKVVQVATAGTTIHTGTSTASDYDEVWLYAFNGHTSAVLLTIEWGGVSVPDDNISLTIPSKEGLVLAVPGLILKGNATPLIIKAFAATGNVIVIYGFVNRIVA